MHNGHGHVRGWIALGVMVAATALAVGCGPSPGTTTVAQPPSAATPPAAVSAPAALEGLASARATLSTMAPDAKLLVVQTAEAVEPTATPIWAYLFGSPSTGKSYMVYVTLGKSMGAQEFSSAGLSADEWAKVPDPGEWKVDSDEALSKALAVGGAKGGPPAYLMGLMTYKPASDTSTVEPFVWSIVFESSDGGSAFTRVDVDARTGLTSTAK